MTQTRNASVRVPGARIHYQVDGSGPVLVVGQSGDGDADRSRDLVAGLTGRFTVVTWDRRGLSRSVCDDPAAPVTMREHAGDLMAVLDEVTDRPVLMLGLSVGAVLGMHVLRAYPERVACLVAHEPIALRLLEPAAEARARRDLTAVLETHRRAGWRAAAGRVAAVLGIDPRGQETEPGISAFPFDERRAANFEYFLGRDLDAALTDDLRASDLPAGAPIVPAVGERSPADGFDHRAALALAGHLGVPAERFPGGHNGNLTHPRAFAARLLDVLGARSLIVAG
ncbi:alpha/beta hydrolase [Actinoplanes oblitus]|uniref:Alpha/beta hydrolase n=1 Tax=Actinoplanes oblitus TaxID=3040509 RepID=A0ABY8WPK5_9ACTN|nr:alpha/beta hydrolase [Actinoplanes oblitus]WIM98810.1 alpha/beta hydrolase [Actinoplanes oblitus]